jgi:predicted dehydrogenase
MKYLIVGFGSIGRRHFRNLLSLGQSDILFFRTRHSTLPEEEISGFPIESDLAAALAHKPDAVIIANPTAFHLDAAIPVAEQGCHILLEKPVSHNLDGLDEFTAIVRKNAARVLVGFQFRFHPNLLQIRNLLQEQVIGQPLYLRSHCGEYLPAWHPWEDYRKSYSARKDLGGGVLLTLCHSLDYLSWIFGEPQVRSSLLSYDSHLGIDVEDVAELSLIFPGDVIGSLHLNYVEIPSKHILEIIGTQGTISWDYYQNSVTVVHLGKSGQTRQILEAPEGFERNDLFLDEMRHFIEVVEGKTDPLCTLEDGILVLKLVSEAKSEGS